MPVAPPSAAFDRLLTRLVRRDAGEAYGMLVVGASFIALFVARAWPPHEIRAALREADDGARALALAGALALYFLATAPIIRQLLASRRLAYLRHLPIAPARWRWIHLRHLVGVNAPWLALAVYGLLPPSPTLGPLARILFGVAWAAWTIAGQVAIVHAGGRARALGIGGATAALAGALLWSGSPIAAAMSGVAASWMLARRLVLAPPEPAARALRWPWAPRRPILALARLDALALLRRAPALLRRRLLHALAIVGAGVLALAAADRAGEAADPGIVRGSLLISASFGAHLLVVAHRLVDRDRWFLDALPPAEGALLGARVLVGLAGAAPPVLLGSAARLLFDDAASAPRILVDAVVVGLFAAATMTWASARAEAERRLHARIFDGPAILTILGLALWLGSAEVLLLTPAIAGLLGASRGALRRAAATRRRLETPRRDDDHQ